MSMSRIHHRWVGIFDKIRIKSLSLMLAQGVAQVRFGLKNGFISPNLL
jgi:hypothetical protein